MAAQRPVSPIKSKAPEELAKFSDSSPEPDDRLRALVRLLARQAAQDYHRASRTRDEKDRS